MLNNSHRPTGMTRAQRLLPFLAWMNLQTSRSVRADLIAGLTGAVLVAPQGVAYALLAGLPPAYGLYTAIIPTILAALFGSSRLMVSGPTAALSIALFATLQPFAESGSQGFISLVLTLTLLAGLFQLLLGLARMGAVVDLVSHTVVIGFTAGAAIIIATSQIPQALGVTPSGSLSFLTVWPYLLDQAGNLEPTALLLASVTLVICYVFKRWLPRWPGMLIALVSAALLAALIDPDALLAARLASIPAGLPPLSMPDLAPDTIRMLIPGAVALGLLGLAEAAAISRALASHSGQRINNNQEFIGQGLSNIGGAFFSSYISSGSFTRSGLNASSGARSPLAAVFAALFLIIMIMLAAPLLQYVPLAAMAGMLLVVAFNLIDFHSIREILLSSRSESAVMLITFISTLMLALEFAIFFGVIVSLALYLRRTTRPPVVESSLSQAPDVLPESLNEAICNVIRIDGSLFFGACESVAQRLEHHNRQNMLILAAGINFIDLSGIHLIQHQAHACQKRGGDLYLAWPKPELLARLQRAGLVCSDSKFANLIRIK